MFKYIAMCVCVQNRGLSFQHLKHGARSVSIYSYSLEGTNSLRTGENGWCGVILSPLSLSLTKH